MKTIFIATKNYPDQSRLLLAFTSLKEARAFIEAQPDFTEWELPTVTTTHKEKKIWYSIRKVSLKRKKKRRLKNFLKSFCWHKWKIVYKEEPQEFFGETIYDYNAEFRICEKCGAVQTFVSAYDGYGPTMEWTPLRKDKADILKKKIEDKGNYYILKTENLQNKKGEKNEMFLPQR